MVLKRLKKLTAKDYGRAIIIGSSVTIFGPMLSGLLSSWLGFIPSWNVLGVSVPHGALAVGIVALVTTLILEKVNL